MSITVDTDIWREVTSGTDRASIRPPERLRVSEWAEKHRHLPRSQTPIPGRWKNENAPYLRGIMDLCIALGVEEVNVQKAAQMGVSEALRNLLAYLAIYEGEPIGLVLPNREKGREIVGNRIIPMFHDTPALRPLLSARAWDTSKTQIRLANGCLWHLMWSGSPASLASDPIRTVFVDETDKCQPWAGREGSPVALADRRTRAYGHRALRVHVSTPTIRTGEIHQLVEASSVILYFFVPCPHCGGFQRLIWQQLKWEKIDGSPEGRADHVLQNPQAVWYECVHCGRPIYQPDRRPMIEAGRWATEDESIPDAERQERWPDGTRIGMRINALYCLWDRWANLVKEFVLCQRSLAAKFDFFTQTLGEPFEQAARATTADLYSQKSRRSKLEAGRVPDWAICLLAAVDTQLDHFFLVVRAYSRERSQRIFHSRVESFEDLDRLCFQTFWRFDGGGDQGLRVSAVAIDSGGTKLEADFQSRTMEVYHWSRQRRARVRVFKGAAKPRESQYIWPGTGVINPGGGRKKQKLTIWLHDSHFWHTVLDDLVHRDLGGQDEVWLLNAEDDPIYNQHMAGLHRIPVRQGRQMIEQWLPVSAGARHDYRDCEAYLCALASLMNVDLLPTERRAKVEREVRADEETQRRRADGRSRRDPWKPTSYRRYLR